MTKSISWTCYRVSRGLGPLLPVSVLVGVLALTVTGCGDDVECPAGDPAIASFTASPTTVVAGADFEVTATIENFELEAHADGEHSHGGECPGGHYHVYLDELMTNPIAMPETATATVTMPAETAAGEHKLIARLHNRDHTILMPEVTSELTVTVE